jgi:hypothetical protein
MFDGVEPVCRKEAVDRRGNGTPELQRPLPQDRWATRRSNSVPCERCSPCAFLEGPAPPANPRAANCPAREAPGGEAYAIRPIHATFDDDTVFALVTGAAALPEKSDALVRLGTIAADVVARAYEADSLGEAQSYRAL